MDPRGRRVARRSVLALGGLWLLLGAAKLGWPNPALLEYLSGRISLPSTVGTWAYWGIGATEAALGLLLVWRRSTEALWASLVLGGLLAAGSVATRDVTQCGCFGRLDVPPWLRVGVALSLFVGSHLALRARTSRRAGSKEPTSAGSTEFAAHPVRSDMTK